MTTLATPKLTVSAPKRLVVQSLAATALRRGDKVIVGEKDYWVDSVDRDAGEFDLIFLVDTLIETPKPITLRWLLLAIGIPVAAALLMAFWSYFHAH